MLRSWLLGCPQLTSIHFGLCGLITDAAVMTLAERCQKLTSITLAFCGLITDAGVRALPTLPSFPLKIINNIGRPLAPSAPQMEILGRPIAYRVHEPFAYRHRELLGRELQSNLAS